MAKISNRAARLWQRLVEWYGARFTEQYGPTAPDDWAEVVDKADNETVKLVLADIRQHHVTYPPTFPEFVQLFARAKPKNSAAPDARERLTAFVLRHRSLTVGQTRMPWNFLGQRCERGFSTTGVVVPADGNAPGYRVMLEDVAGEDPPPSSVRPRPDLQTAISELSKQQWGPT